MKIDLNSDLGESFGVYKLGLDGEVIPYLTSANVACGYHAGDPLVMERTVTLCKEHGVAVGAHPGFPDLMGFGRRQIDASPAEAKAYVKYQVGALWAFCKAAGVPMQHVKPHGALYNQAAKDPALARAVAEAVQEVDPALILMGLSGSQMIAAAREIGLPYASEVFADRAYNADGTLADRRLPGAMIHDVEECGARVLRMIKEHRLTAITGEELTIQPHSVCVHGDTPEAVAFVKRIRQVLEENGVRAQNLLAAQP